MIFLQWIGDIDLLVELFRLVMERPLPNGLKVSAGVHRVQVTPRCMRFVVPNPCNDSNVGRTHDALPERIDTVVHMVDFHQMFWEPMVAVLWRFCTPDL